MPQSIFEHTFHCTKINKYIHVVNYQVCTSCAKVEFLFPSEKTNFDPFTKHLSKLERTTIRKHFGMIDYQTCFNVFEDRGLWLSTKDYNIVSLVNCATDLLIEYFTAVMQLFSECLLMLLNLLTTHILSNVTGKLYYLIQRKLVLV